jgi:tetratricopeptide (TPR) repeat protein
MEREESQVEAGLGRLLEAQVLELRGDNRFGWHNLMRLFSKEQLTNSAWDKVLDRGLTWYCQWATFWNRGLDPVSSWFQRLVKQLVSEKEYTREEGARVLLKTALNCFATEQDNWVDIVNDLTQVTRIDNAIELAANLAPFFDLYGIWGDWVTTHEMVEDNSQQASNLNVAKTLNNFGLVYYYDQGKWDDAIACYEKSLEIKHQLGDLHGARITLKNLGLLHDRRNQPE